MEDEDTDVEFFSLEELTQLRHALSTFINPSKEITDAIAKLDTYIANIINEITQES